MTIRGRMAGCGFLLLGLIAFGCAPTAAPKPDPPSKGTGSASTKSSETARSGDGQRGATKESDADRRA